MFKIRATIKCIILFGVLVLVIMYCFMNMTYEDEEQTKVVDNNY